MSLRRFREQTVSARNVNNTTLRIPAYRCYPNVTIVNEGQAVRFDVPTFAVTNNTTLYWSNLGTAIAADFDENINSGSFVVNNNAGSFTLTMRNDLVTEGLEYANIVVRTDSVSGPIVAVANQIQINDTSIQPNYQVNPSSSSINEGSTVTFTVITLNLPNGFNLYYTLDGTNVNASDISGGTLSGTLTINSNTASVSVTLINDVAAEGNETMTFNLRTGSTSGNIVANTAVTIVDTSIPNPVVYSTAGTYTFNPTAGSWTIKCWGGGGGGAPKQQSGGAGGCVVKTLTVGAGETWTIYVGGGGAAAGGSADNGTGYFGNGGSGYGAGGRGGGPNGIWCGGGGGGSSGVTGPSVGIIYAGGGGGGGGDIGSSGGAGGTGTGTGGSAGGGGQTGTAGVNGGGGGGGSNGGNQSPGGGGGGGANSVPSGTAYPGSGTTVANTGDGDYAAPAGQQSSTGRVVLRKN